MAGLAIALPSAPHTNATLCRPPHPLHRRRRRSRVQSLPHIQEGHHHGPVHSLNTADHKILLDRWVAADYNKHKLAPTATVEALTLDPLQHHKAAQVTARGYTTPPTSPAGQALRVHSLTDMTVPAQRTRVVPDMQAPDSPPYLSSSKSSKSSSSLRSSILSDAAGADISTHFEDISLGDTKRDSYDFNAHKDNLPRAPQRPLHSVIGAKRKQKPTVDTLRSVHMAQPRPGSTARPGGVLDDKCTNMPANRTIRPVSRTGSGGFMPRSPTQYGDSRSPSPTKSLMSVGLQRSAASIPGSTAHSFLSVNHGNPGTRKTWAPGRKTVKQLEDEYHDSDEDVPEDAIIWNVPVSPLEPFTMASRDPSPRRQSSQSSLSSAGRPSVPDRQPSVPSAVAIGFNSNSSSPHLTLPRSATTGSFPDPVSDLYSLRERHQSWNNDLSHEARDIASALEAHNASRRQSVDTRNSFSTPLTSPSANVLTRSQSNSSSLSLPPIQKSNIMIDPLPISKQKEAVLTRTRPSWLPPKCQKEERKHLKEWERMMAQSAVAEKRRATQKLTEIEERRYSDSSLSRLWEEHVLPNWDEAIKEQRTREMWWRGVPAKSRGEIWRRAIGNNLQLTPASYAAALKRGRESLSSEQQSRIASDAASAFPETGLFASSSPLLTTLVEVLTAHAAYRPDVPASGTSTHRVAALLLLHIPTAEEAFIALANVLSRPLSQAYLTGERAGVERYTSLVLSTLKVKLPGLHEHFLSSKIASTSRSGAGQQSTAVDSATATPALDDGLSPLSRASTMPERGRGSLSAPGGRRRQGQSATRAIPAEGLIAPMLEGLFTSHLPLEALERIWDVYVFEGDKAVVRAYVGLCSLVESRLYGDREECLAVLKEGEKRMGAWDGFEVEEIVGAVREAGKVGVKGR